MPEEKRRFENDRVEAERKANVEKRRLEEEHHELNLRMHRRDTLIQQETISADEANARKAKEVQRAADLKMLEEQRLAAKKLAEMQEEKNRQNDDC